MNPRIRALAAAAALTLVCGEIGAQTIGVHLDRNPVRADETVRLTIEADFPADGVRPDIAPL